jgi:nucleotide-binding universal stress UspA family protein
VEISRILYATDGSAHARKALDWVVDIARRRQAKVIAVTAYEPIPRDLGSPYLEDLMARRPAEGQALVQEAPCPVLIVR